MPNVRHVVVGVEVLPTGLVVDEPHPASHELDRRSVAEFQARPEPLLPVGERLRTRHSDGCRRQQTENAVRIRRQLRPDRLFARPGDTGEVRAQVQQVENNLKVQVWRPTPVFTDVAEPADQLTGSNLLPFCDEFIRLPREVSIQREERVTRVGRVSQDDQCSVVEWLRILMNPVHDTRNRRTHGAPGCVKQIQPEMNRPSLSIPAIAGELPGRVQKPRFQVAPDSDVRAGSIHLRADHQRDSRLAEGAFVTSDESACDTQVQDTEPAAVRTVFQREREVPAIPVNPVLNGR